MLIAERRSTYRKDGVRPRSLRPLELVMMCYSNHESSPALDQRTCRTSSSTLIAPVCPGVLRWITSPDRGPCRSVCLFRLTDPRTDTDFFRRIRFAGAAEGPDAASSCKRPAVPPPIRTSLSRATRGRERIGQLCYERGENDGLAFESEQ
jgi:hypothetical protein